jgi:signal transduction histidine kinase
MLERATGAVEHTVLVLDGFQNLLKYALDAETSQRGYLLTGEQRYLGPYASGTQGMHDELRSLQSLMADDGQQRRGLDPLVAALTAKERELDRTIALRRSGDSAGALRLVRTDSGLQAMDEVRRTVLDGQRLEDAVLVERSRARDRARLLVVLIIVPGALAACLLTFFKVRTAQRDLRNEEVANERLEQQTFQLQDQASELELQAEELEQQVDELESLRVAAEDASRAKSDFIASMSHELRTPLNAIIGYTGLVRDGLAGPTTVRQEDFLGRIRSSADHLLGLIEDVLSLSRIEAGEIAIRWSLTDAYDAMRETAVMVEPAARAKNLTLVVDVPPKPISIETDRQRLHQCLINLANNAVKYTDTGSVRMQACVDGEVVIFEVTDSGLGIAPEHMDRIFDAFWQVEQSTTRRVGGAGLGLNVTRRLARLLGGEVSARSVAGEGSTFSLRLPRRRGVYP